MTAFDCTRAEELLSDDCEGTLDPLFRDDLQAHLAECAPCRSLRSALLEVVEDLRRAPDLAPPSGLADRIAAAVVRERTASARRPRVLRFQAAAAVAAIVGTTALLASREPVRRQATRLVERASSAAVYLDERKDRLLEDVRILRVVVGAAFEGRMDRVNDRVEDYRRLLERRRSSSEQPEQKKSQRLPGGPRPASAVGPGRLSANPGQSGLVNSRCG
jgi:hypothetical protein